MTIVQYPIIGSIISPLSIALDQGYFLALFDRTFPFGYIYPMKTTPDGGYEVFEATAASGARVSLAIQREENDLLTMFAPTGAYATGTVTFSRPTFTAGAVTIEAGTVLTTSKGGKQFTTNTDVVFGATDLGPHTCTVTAVAFGYVYNTRGPFTAASGAAIPGEIDTIYTLTTSPPYGDISFVVAQAIDTTGGTDMALERLAWDRGIARSNNESPEPFRLRVRTLPDTVSPGAIQRVVQSVMGNYLYVIREVGRSNFRGMFYGGDEVLGVVDRYDFYDVDSLVFNGVVTSGVFIDDEPVVLIDAALNVYAHGYFGNLELGNTRLYMIRKGGAPSVGGTEVIRGLQSGAVFTPSSFIDVSAAVNARRFRLNLDYAEFRGFFLVGLPRLNLGEFGMAYDDGPRDAFDYNTTIAVTGTQNFADGFPAEAERLYTSVYRAVDRVKAGGVGFDIYIEDIGP